MSKETEIVISVKLKDGPKTLPENTKLPKDYCALNINKAISEELEITSSNCTPEAGVDVKPNGSGELVFVTIHADRYKYKDSCGIELPGIRYATCPTQLGSNEENAEVEYLDGPHVYVSRRIQNLDFEKLYFKVCDEMFDCIKEPDKKKIVINVTYGVGVPNGKECLPCTPCPKPADAAAH